MHRSEEDYLKAIYEISVNTESNLVKSVDIAETLGFTVQSVNEKIKRLDSKGYVNFIPYKGVELTKKGLEESIRMVRAHRIWEVFLMEKLGYSWHEVHEEAEDLEHAASDKLIERIYNLIGRPKYCGHGNPIPSFDGKIENIYKKSLFEFDLGSNFILKRVFDNKKLLIDLNKKDIKINDEFNVLSKNDKVIIIVKNNIEYTITNNQSKMLFGD